MTSSVQTASTKEIPPIVMYKSVRKEILDQKKCQFQIFSAALALTAAVLAYAGTTHATPLVYVAPVIMNVLALTIILDKAISIQRMVGYLQLMEKETDIRQWMWEYHLNIFRGLPAKSAEQESHRKHTYIRNVALILVILNAFASLLYGLGPSAVALRQSQDYQNVREIYGALSLIVIALNIGGIWLAGHRWRQLVYGAYTSNAIRKRWLETFEESKKDKPI